MFVSSGGRALQGIASQIQFLFPVILPDKLHTLEGDTLSSFLWPMFSPGPSPRMCFLSSLFYSGSKEIGRGEEEREEKTECVEMGEKS